MLDRLAPSLGLRCPRWEPIANEAFADTQFLSYRLDIHFEGSKELFKPLLGSSFPRAGVCPGGMATRPSVQCSSLTLGSYAFSARSNAVRLCVACSTVSSSLSFAVILWVDPRERQWEHQ